MRLVYVTASMPFGRGEEFLVSEVSELLRQGHEVLVVPRSPKGSVINKDAEKAERNSLRRHLLSPFVFYGALLELIHNPIAAIRAFTLLFKSGNLNNFCKNMGVFPKGLWLAGMARKWRADHIHAHWALTTATMAMIASELSGIPWSFTAHRGDIVGSNMLSIKVEKAAFARFISKSGQQMAKELGAVNNAGCSCVIHMGVETPALPVTLNKSTENIKIFCPANFYPVKGHKYLIEAMRILMTTGARCMLFLAGVGETRKDIQDHVVRLGLGTVVSFLGQVPHDQLLKVYKERQADIVVLPSLDLGNSLHEGVPVCLMEAMAYGIPVVSTATGGIPELLSDGAGITVSPQDAEALAGAIIRLIQDPALMMNLGIAGRRRIEEQFSVERTVSELINCIKMTRIKKLGRL